MHALVVENLSKIYKGGVKALSGVSFSVEEGDFFALLGPNGAGKSTLIGILSSLVHKSSGKAYLFGHDIDSDFSAAKLAIGLVPQEFNFNSFYTVHQILSNQAGYYGISAKAAKPRIELYLKKLGLWDKRNKSAISLSGGMKRRLLIARGLIHQPRMLILDEPTAGVDIELRRLMWDFLLELNRGGTTIILTTHYLEEAEYLCRHIAIIDNGLLVAHSSMAELLQKLESEKFILYLENSLQQVPDVEGYTITKIDATTLEVEVSKEFGLSRLFHQLSEQGVRVSSMRNKVSRLEELFLRLTKE